jgi:hypothetical protein
MKAGLADHGSKDSQLPGEDPRAAHLAIIGWLADPRC